MKHNEITERNKAIATMLGLKSLCRPYDGAFMVSQDTRNSTFYSEKIIDERNQEMDDKSKIDKIVMRLKELSQNDRMSILKELLVGANHTELETLL